MAALGGSQARFFSWVWQGAPEVAGPVGGANFAGCCRRLDLANDRTRDCDQRMSRLRGLMKS